MYTPARIRVKRKAVVVDLNRNIVHCKAYRRKDEKDEKDANDCADRYYYREY